MDYIPYVGHLPSAEITSLDEWILQCFTNRYIITQGCDSSKAEVRCQIEFLFMRPKFITIFESILYFRI